MNLWDGRGSRDNRIVAGFIDPSTTKDPPCRAAMLNESETSSRWCGVVVRRGGASSGVVHVDHGSKYVVRRQKPSYKCDVHSESLEECLFYSMHL
ncbi:hypothetical protein TNCV_3507991 [Trichonephila clavipes]|uniref:Uncharacterized protein n=1 Tax=Trichonephila clavipes TaxID=2585209 RepID=A0A8X6VCZ7_TRICX|nr:hypothetical protein TNCV_3507991 [Trichonephila clavipes]